MLGAPGAEWLAAGTAAASEDSPPPSPRTPSTEPGLDGSAMPADAAGAAGIMELASMQSMGSTRSVETRQLLATQVCSAKAGTAACGRPGLESVAAQQSTCHSPPSKSMVSPASACSAEWAALRMALPAGPAGAPAAQRGLAGASCRLRGHLRPRPQVLARNPSYPPCWAAAASHAGLSAAAGGAWPCSQSWQRQHQHRQHSSGPAGAGGSGGGASVTAELRGRH